jgi:hypothetical protein
VQRRWGGGGGCVLRWVTSVPFLFSRPVVYMYVRDSVNILMFLCRNISHTKGLSFTYNYEPHRVTGGQNSS